jgi:putative membrane protein
MRAPHVTVALSVLLALGLAACGSGDRTAPSTPAVAAAPAAAPAAAMPIEGVAFTEENRQFLTQAIQSGLAEVELARLARDRTESRAVRGFAQLMVDDHSAANQQLTALANAAGVTPPTQPDQAHQNLYAQLSALSGPAFDRAYMQGQVLNHQQAVDLFARQAQGDDQVARFAAQQLPVLQRHLSMAQAISETLR